MNVFYIVKNKIVFFFIIETSLMEKPITIGNSPGVVHKVAFVWSIVNFVTSNQSATKNDSFFWNVGCRGINKWTLKQKCF